MADSEKSLFERLKPIWEAVEKLGEIDPEFDAKTFLDEMWEEDYAESAALWEARNSLGISDAELAKDLETQLKMIAAAYATAEAAQIDRVVNYIAFIRRLKKQGLFDLGGSNEGHPDG
ncbi:hypothetical protein [Ruegeria sp. YS9]|uniref:hypothetical protein n=1 Tax=Ruegeria sp. YS9 TaxID=2966453 RepID=UPI00214BDD85|nr:hypothetical protein [Ruegeria sp. YS9]UUV05504.1 hypothetical protein NOR97_12855 [Ruegeria sp. YS9]